MEIYSVGSIQFLSIHSLIGTVNDKIFTAIDIGNDGAMQLAKNSGWKEPMQQIRSVRVEDRLDNWAGNGFHLQ
tara:strand:+ start:2149 stop:2367 length:219 start_codon:yes stop_codon:yes gene_type:complete